VGDRAPRFAIAELHGERVERFQVTAGHAGAEHAGGAAAPEGLVLAEPLLRVRATLLDHRTPVVAYALEPNADIKVRKERLAALGLKPGPWLAQLKRAVAARETGAALDLPNGDRRTAGDLAAELLLIRPGKKLVYATDLADTTANREHLVALARGAHTLFCEAAFCETDAERAAATGHLTARACGEIATTSGVERLVPFHFSRRYEDDRAKVYREVRAACARAIEPREQT
jgi:ribonuclease BN (tRNA processing enzyme)